MKDFLENNKRELILAGVLLLFILIFVGYNTIKNIGKEKKEPTTEYGQGISIYEGEDLSNWDMNLWNVSSDSFSFYFKNGIIYHSNFVFEKDRDVMVFVCFYGDDNSKFASTAYYDATGSYTYGTQPVLQRVPEQQQMEVETWRANTIPFATESINDSEDNYYYYILTKDNFDFAENKFAGTSYVFNYNISYSESDKTHTFLNKDKTGYNYFVNYGIPGPMLNNVEKRMHEGKEWKPDVYKLLDLDNYNLNGKYIIVDKEIYKEFSNLNTVEEKKAYCEANVININNNYDYAIFTDAGVNYQGTYWAVYLDNAKTVEETEDFSSILGSFGDSSNDYQPTNITLDSYLSYSGKCSLLEAKELTNFIYENIMHYPNMMK